MLKLCHCGSGYMSKFYSACHSKYLILRTLYGKKLYIVDNNKEFSVYMLKLSTLFQCLKTLTLYSNMQFRNK